MIVLRSSDGETFEVDEAVALESQTIKHMIEDDCADTSIPLPNVTSKILVKVIEYCKRHVEVPKAEDKTAEEDLKTFDAEFVNVDQSILFDLILKCHIEAKGVAWWSMKWLRAIRGSIPSGDKKTLIDSSHLSYSFTWYLLLMGGGRNPMELVEAANYLNIKSLLDLTCQTVADMIKGKTPEEIRKTFNIKNDFTPEEEEEVRRENAWAFE
ncbi:hypothetical protein MTR67_045027 [Solanum verrucosum]|uniref:SKP1-like protein n=1 Tax=Solanum verrucosum TaxID=315347 RepID=A0AAF0USK3_SOLVR|nr:hypothetical protein MTR67_045027 [Solanum verrucosum]